VCRYLSLMVVSECVDLTKLNKNFCRERHILPSVDDNTLAKLSEATIFSKLNATVTQAFWQIKLAKESALLTMFITPFGSPPSLLGLYLSHNIFSRYWKELRELYV